MTRSFDAVVAGGGLAGALGARALAERGLRVLMAERKDDPGDFNYCAEAVFARGIAPFDAFSHGLVAAPIDGGLLVGPGDVTARLLYPGVGYVLHRDQLMRRVFEQAVSAGVDGRLGHEVCDVHRDRGGRLAAVSIRNPAGVDRVPCRGLLAADGIASGVGRLAGVDSRLQVGEIWASAQYRVRDVDVEVGFPEFWIGDIYAPGGYAWVFPRGGRVANVGLAIVADRPSAKGQTATYWLKRFRRHRFKSPSKIDSYITGGIPTLVRKPPSSAQGTVLAGDAVRSADPLSAAGIAEAMDSGRRAGLCLADALDEGDLSSERLEAAYRDYRAARPRLPAMTAIRRIFDRLDDRGKARMTQACRDAFDGRRIDQEDPIRMVLRLLKAHPSLVVHARHLVGV